MVKRGDTPARFTSRPAASLDHFAMFTYPTVKEKREKFIRKVRPRKLAAILLKKIKI